MRVVVLLEMIEVDEHQGKRPTVAGCSRMLDLERLEKVPTIEQSRQCIPGREIRELLVQLLQVLRTLLQAIHHGLVLPDQLYLLGRRLITELIASRSSNGLVR